MIRELILERTAGRRAERWELRTQPRRVPGRLLPVSDYSRSMIIATAFPPPRQSDASPRLQSAHSASA